MLEHRLVNSPTFDPAVARGMGEFMASVHAATHTSTVGRGEAAELFVKFRNQDLRGLQLEYVFTKAFSEGGEEAKTLAEDQTFMRGVEDVKRRYVGEGEGGLALCHGDLHPGSVMVNNAARKVKIIDPEFAVYGPPGLDLGSLLSGVVLAAQHHKYGGGEEGAVERIKAFASDVVDSYASAASGLGREAINEAISDALGFCACEVARTALGFAGGRLWLQFEDEELKKKALRGTVEVAKGLMLGRARGLDALMEAF